MNLRSAVLLLALNAVVTFALLSAYAYWFAPARAPALAVLDVGELYRLKESEVTATLLKQNLSEDERATALKRTAQFGKDVSLLLESLPEECRCLVLARGAVIGAAPLLPDLTASVRQRLGL